MLSNQVLQRINIRNREYCRGYLALYGRWNGHRIVQAGTESPGAGERIQAFLEEIKK